VSDYSGYTIATFRWVLWHRIGPEDCSEWVIPNPLECSDVLRVISLIDLTTAVTAPIYRQGEKHGGSIWAEAEPEHGASFYFTVGIQEPTRTTEKTSGNETLEYEHERQG